MDVQESEESFDLALIASLEIDVVPYIGDHRIPDILVSQLGKIKILHAGNQAYDIEGGSLPIWLNVSSSSTFSTSASFPGHATKIISVDIEKIFRLGDYRKWETCAMGEILIGVSIFVLDML